MINPYALSFINLILFIILGLGLITYKFIFPKKNINLFFLLILISLLPVWSIFRPGVYESGDFSLHVTQSITFYKSLSEGILIPRWAGQLNATYGFPAFIFIYSLPYYIISFFHFIGFTFITSTKLLLATSFITSGISMYIWLKDELNARAGFIAAIFYLYVPYHLVDMHFRADIGEMLAFALLPINLYLAKKFIKTKSSNFFILQSLIFALLIISHPAISLASPPLIIIYTVFCWLRLRKNNIKVLIISFISLCLGVLISTFSWLPTLSELKFTHQFLVNSISFPNIFEFIFSPWRYGLLFQGPKGELSYILGYIQIGVIIYITYLFLSKKSKLENFSLISLFFLFFLGYFFMMLSISEPLWHVIPFIKNFQFAYRLLLFTSIFTSVLGSLILYKVKNVYIICLIVIVVIGSTILNWGNRRVIPQFNDKYLINQLPLSTANGGGLGQATPIWTDPNNTWQKIVPTKHLEVIKGRTDINELIRTTNIHEYVINVTEDSILRENTLYFPGWNLYINRINYPISITNQNPKGVIEFKIKKGIYDVVLNFEDTFIIKISKILSLLGIILILAIGIKSYFSPH